jgi:hypothetical protein
MEASPATVNRPLSIDERELICWLIDHGGCEASGFASQIAETRVIGYCGCGCPTIDLEVGRAPRANSGVPQVLADFVGETPEGLQVGVILFAKEGRLSELEVYSLSGHEKPFSLPTIRSLKPF